ncbi:MAG TPA: ABC transporter permease [Candidatus Acidoferrales bacterium]|nr:ABC transporter permease [Candidatus Acidoferrales bacterium]
MRKIWLVVKREYVTRVKTKGFVIVTLMVPLIGIVTVVLIAFLATHRSDQNVRMAIVDNAGGLAESAARSLSAERANGKPEFTIVESIGRPASPDAVQQGLRDRINSGALDAYLVIPGDLAKPVEFHTKNPGNFALLEPLSAAVNQTMIEARLRARGVRVDDVSEISRGADLQIIKVSQSGESIERGQTIGIGIGLVILLYMSLLLYGVTTMRSVLEEKTTRTMEVLISSVAPVQLLAGKILGVAAVAFTQFTVWIVSLGLLLSYSAVMAAMFNPGSSFPKIHIPISLLIWALLFFFGGYFLYSAMFAAIGAACSSEEDAQQLQWLAMGPLVFTMTIYWTVLSDPASKASFILSEIPLCSPVLMPLRMSVQTPPLWQTALSIALLVLTTVGAIYASARIYRIGVLMYGKRPTLPELVRWLRYS